MYKEHFGLEEMPFSIAPDPRYLYMSGQHREALAHLLYGINGDGGFVLLTGEVGTGKTTVCRCLLEQVPENTSIAFIINPKLTAEELLAVICDEFGITYPEGNRSIKVFIDLINGYLFAAHDRGQKAILIVDEAQNLSADVLEQLRLLTNLETNQVKLLQIILLGQPELRDKLSEPELRQLSQRIIARYHLGPLSKKEAASYITHRLTIAGVKRQLFSASSVDALYRYSGGIPRLINVLCDRSLLGAFSMGKNEVDKAIVNKAAGEVFGASPALVQLKKIYIWASVIFTVLVVSVIFAATFYTKRSLHEIQKTTTALPEAVKPVTPSLPSVSSAEKTVPSALVSPAENTPLKPEALLLPEGISAEQSRLTSFRSLFNAWNLPHKPVSAEDACSYAQAHGMVCYQQKGNLHILRMLDHPAILRLINDQGKDFYVALSVLGEKEATLMIGPDPKTVSLDEIEAHWLGDYTLLWSVPSDYSDEIKPGKQDALVPWLDKQLTVIQKREYKARANTVYDDELVEHVRSFQLTSGLVPDGIVGPQTIMLINIATDNKIPALTRTLKKE